MRWSDVEPFLLTAAEDDLRDEGSVRPCLVGFIREAQALVSFLRPVERTELPDALIELIAITCPLGVDRIALSVSGRATSWDDPIAPAIDGVGDLRQRVVALQVADAEQQPVVSGSVHPFSVDDNAVTWEPALRHESSAGWIGNMLAVAVVEGRAQLRASDDEIRKQMQRCTDLGHLLGLGPAVAERLGFPAMEVR